MLKLYTNTIVLLSLLISDPVRRLASSFHFCYRITVLGNFWGSCILYLTLGFFKPFSLYVLFDFCFLSMKFSMFLALSQCHAAYREHLTSYHCPSPLSTLFLLFLKVFKVSSWNFGRGFSFTPREKIGVYYIISLFILASRFFLFL